MTHLLIEAGVLVAAFVCLCGLLAAVDKACDVIERAGRDAEVLIRREASCPASRRQRAGVSPQHPARSFAQEAHASFCVRGGLNRTADIPESPPRDLPPAA